MHLFHVNMEAKFQIGDLVWAKMKGFPAWPGKVIQPKPEVKRPKDKKPYQFVYFFGSENYAWVPDETIYNYREHKERFNVTSRIPRGFKEAVVAIEEAMDDQVDDPASAVKLPTIDDELKQMQRVADLQAKREHAKNKRHGAVCKMQDEIVEERSVRVTVKPKPLPISKPSSKGARQTRVAPTYGLQTTFSVIAQVHTQLKEREKSAEQSGHKRSAATSPAVIASKKARLLDKSRTMPAVQNRSTTYPPKASTSPLAANIFDGFTNGEAGVKEGRVTPPPAQPDPSIMLKAPLAEELSSMIATPLRIGFIGLGIMGSGMVSQLLKTNHEVTVWNRTSMKCREFIKQGALKGNSPSDVVSQCDITFSCVSDPTALRDIVFGNTGVLQGLKPGKAYVDMSTVDVDTITDVSEAITNRGGRFLEAPVIGSRGPASKGELVVLAAGDITLYEDCHTCFKAMSKKSFYLGDTGNAIRMKLIVNMLMGTTMAGLAESMALAEKVGLDQAEVLQVLNLSALASTFIDQKGSAMIMSDFEAHTLLRDAQKDLRLSVVMADYVDQPLHVTSASNELFKKAKAKGYGDHDVSAVYRAADV